MSEIIKAAAYEYWKIGANVVLLKEKKPVHVWQEWISRRQTLTEFESLPWHEASQYGVICGTKLSSGLFLGVLDHDVKNLAEETIQKGRQVLEHFSITRLEETPSGGLHLVFYCRTEPKSISAFHNDCALELIGQGKLCTMAPSEGYRNLNDNTPTIIEDLESLLYDCMSKAGIKVKEERTKAWFDREDLIARPYRKSNPLCIRELLKGAKEGQRNDYAIRLSSYYVNFRQLQPKQAFQELTEWNTLNAPSLSDTELRTIFDSAIKGRYVFGCNDAILKKFCILDAECPLRKKPGPLTGLSEQKTFDVDTEVQINLGVQRILEADNQLDALTPHLDVLCVGENSIKKTLVVLLRSAKESNAEAKQIIILKGTEGVGKSSLLRKLTQGYKVKEVARFSAHALDYTNLEGYEILVLKELGSMDEEKQGVSTVKFLSSDDRGYTVEVTAKDEKTGKFTTELYTIPPITVGSTTTRLVFDPQFERRAWPLGLDETPEQTARIAQWKAKNELQNAEKILGLRKLTDYELSSEIYRRFIDKYESKTIIIPFPQTLLNVLGTEALRVRGDFDKLLNFAKLYGTFNLKRLQEVKDGVFLLSPEVAVEALKIALEPLTAMLSRIDKRTKRVFDMLNEIKDIEKRTILDRNGKPDSVEVEVSYNHSGAVIDKKIRERIAVKIGKAETTIRRFLNQLEDSGYVSGNQKKPKVYTLLYDVEDIKKKFSGLSVKLESSDNLILEMRNEAQKWLETTSCNLFPAVRKETTPSVDKRNDYASTPTVEKRLHDPSLPPSQTALAEKPSNDRQIEKSPINQEEKTCGQCALWHKGGCSFPGDPNCVTPTNAYAVDCHSFINGTQKEQHAGTAISVISVIEEQREVKG